MKMGPSRKENIVTNNTPKTRSGASRQRQWAPKVRTGCMICKIRRVKCDETKPSCRRCLSTGRKCDGYEDPEPEHTRQGSNLPVSKKVARRENPVHDLLSAPSAQCLLPGNEIENQHFDFFRSVTTSNLANFFDFGFWSYHLLQASHQYPALFHATTAFGSIHRAFLSDDTPATVPRVDTDRKAEFALKQFNKSIQSLSKLLSQNKYSFLDQQVVLTTCILFACLCILQGRQPQAFMHVNNGIKMLRQWRLNDRNLRQPGSTGVVMDMLMLVFTRLDTQILPYLDGQESVLQWTRHQIIPPAASVPFQSLLEAYVDLEIIFNRGLRLVLNEEYHIPARPVYILEEKESVFRQLEEWDNRLADFLAKSTFPQNEADKNAVDLLRLRRGFATVLLSTETFRGQHAHDDLFPIYEELLKLAANVLQHTDPDESFSDLDDIFREKKPQHPIFTAQSLNPYSGSESAVATLYSDAKLCDCCNFIPVAKEFARVCSPIRLCER